MASQTACRCQYPASVFDQSSSYSAAIESKERWLSAIVTLPPLKRSCVEQHGPPGRRLRLTSHFSEACRLSRRNCENACRGSEYPCPCFVPSHQYERAGLTPDR